MSAMKFISGFKLQPPAILFLRVIAGLLIATGLTLFLTAPKRVKSPENPPPPPIAAAVAFGLALNAFIGVKRGTCF